MAINRRDDATLGLTSAEAKRRLAEYGPNEPAPVRRLSLVVQFFHLFANPLVVILLVASAIAGSLLYRNYTGFTLDLLVPELASSGTIVLSSKPAQKRIQARLDPRRVSRIYVKSIKVTHMVPASRLGTVVLAFTIGAFPGLEPHQE